MSLTQGWCESDDDYRARVAQDADERTVEQSTGSAPSKGWFESDEAYRDRIAQAANECRIEESTGSAPSQRWFESDETYRARIALEANERTIEDASGVGPSQGWFENDDDYEIRIRKEANEHIVSGSGSSPRQGWLERDHEYRSRIAHEAREVRARERAISSDYGGYSSGSYAGSSGSSSGFLVPLILVALIGSLLLFFTAIGYFANRNTKSAASGPVTKEYNTVRNGDQLHVTDKEWTLVRLPAYSWFEIRATSPILIRLKDGSEFIGLPNKVSWRGSTIITATLKKKRGRVAVSKNKPIQKFIGYVPVKGLGKNIPTTVNLRTLSGNAIVTFSMQPK